MFGLDPDTIRSIKAALAKFPDLEKVILYGSRAKGNYKNGSDIDITLIGKNLTLDNSVYPLMDELDELYLPYTFDISIFKQIDNLDLVGHILRVGKTFYLKENGKLKVENGDDNFQLPKGWEVKRLGEVCTIKPPKKLAKEKLSDEELVTFFPMENLKEFNHYISPVQTKRLKDVYRGYVYFKNNDVLLAKITPCFENGKLGIARNLKNGIGFGSSEYMVFRPDNNISSEYIYYFLSLDFIRREGKVRMTGAVGHKRIPVEYFSNQNLIIPPLPEQQRIVEILDKAFFSIDNAKLKIENNLRNAKELFENYLQGVFENKGDDWEEKTLKQVSEDFGRGKSKHRPRNDKKLYGGGYPFIQTGDVRNCKHYITDYSQTYNDTGLAQSKLWPIGTICITIAANIAETGILTFAACFPDSVIGVVVNEKLTNVEFVEYLLQSFKVNLQSLGKGSAQDNINMGTFKNKLFPFPSITEQKQIVKKLNNLSIETKKLETIYQQKINNLDELKKSILQKAFRGEL